MHREKAIRTSSVFLVICTSTMLAAGQNPVSASDSRGGAATAPLPATAPDSRADSTASATTLLGPPEASDSGTDAAMTPARVNGPYGWGDATLLPMPNDLYTVRDDSTQTGRRLELPVEAWSEHLLDRAPFDARALLERLAQKDGFSPNLPVMLSIPALLDSSLLPSLEASKRADSPIVLVNLDAYRRVPFRAVTMPREDAEHPSTLLFISPHDRLEHGNRYAVVIRRGLRDDSGREIPPLEGLAAALSGRPLPEHQVSAEHQLEMAALGEALAQLGYPPDDVALAFSFTVESRESYVRPLKALDWAVEARALEVPFRAGRFRMHRRPLKGKGKACFQGKGHFEALRFVDDRGRLLDIPELQSLEFKLRMPETCPALGCPVVIFGHGLAATKQTMFQVADDLAARGIATIATNTIWHDNQLQPIKVLLGLRKNFELFHALFLEHIMRNVQLVELIRQDLAGRDLTPGDSSDGRHHAIRGDQIMYIGQSMGGLCGVGIAFLAPDIRSAVFDVAGGSTIDMLFDSRLTRLLRVPLETFEGLTERESTVLMPLAAYLMDDVDPLGLAPFLGEERLPGEPVRIVSQQAGVGDGLVPNESTEKLARALGLVQAWPRAEAPDEPTSQVRGPALRYYHFTDSWFFAHLELFRTGSVAADFFVWSLDQMGDVPTEVYSIR